MSRWNGWKKEICSIALKGPRFEHGVDCPAFGSYKRRCSCGATSANATLDRMKRALNSKAGLYDFTERRVSRKETTAAKARPQN